MSQLREVTRVNLAKKDIATRIVRKIKNKAIKITIKSIKKDVLNYYNISPEVAETKTRKREIVKARQIIMTLCSVFIKDGLAVIGKKTFKKDHATVIHSKKTVKNLIETEKPYRNDIYNLCLELGYDYGAIEGML